MFFSVSKLGRPGRSGDVTDAVLGCSWHISTHSPTQPFTHREASQHSMMAQRHNVQGPGHSNLEKCQQNNNKGSSGSTFALGELLDSHL